MVLASGDGIVALLVGPKFVGPRLQKALRFLTQHSAAHTLKPDWHVGLHTALPDHHCGTDSSTWTVHLWDPLHLRRFLFILRVGVGFPVHMAGIK